MELEIYSSFHLNSKVTITIITSISVFRYTFYFSFSITSFTLFRFKIVHFLNQFDGLPNFKKMKIVISKDKTIHPNRIQSPQLILPPHKLYRVES